MEENSPANEEKKSYGKRPIWQWILIYAAIAIVLYGLFYYFVLAKKGSSTNQANPYQNPASQTVTSPTTAQASPAAAQNAVSLTSTGFTPASLTIKVGDTVTWTNNSGQAATVNSDPHPTHTAYPPLNLGKFDNGGTLTLTFNKPGTYGYHNHLNPSVRGTIIVQ